MAKLGSRENLWRCACTLGALLFISCAVAAGTSAKAKVESAQAASNSAVIAPQATQVPPSTSQGPPAENKPADLPGRVDPAAAEANRKALEAAAGKDAAKLLLRSVPSQATIYIDGSIVGQTPMLLFIAPGRHKVEMRGASEEYGEREIDPAAKETEEIALTLTLRYPAIIAVHPEASPTSAAGIVTVTGAQLVPRSRAAEEDAAQDFAVKRDSIAAEMNRKILEQQAGKDAAKLLLQSAPTEAMIYIDGMFVGRAPQSLTLAPGNHKVEMRGQRDEFGESLVGLLPNETQRLTLTLTVRYPAKISVH